MTELIYVVLLLHLQGHAHYSVSTMIDTCIKQNNLKTIVSSQSEPRSRFDAHRMVEHSAGD
jgi:hypothetical protein